MRVAATRPINALTVRQLEARRSQLFSLTISRLSVQAGKVLCVVGANGSGKTTFIEVLTNLLTPRRGSVHLFKQPLTADNIKQKRLVGFIPDDDTWIIPELTPQELFRLHAAIYAIGFVDQVTMVNRSKQMARSLHFTAFNQQIGSLSHGNKKKVQIISALMHQPKLIIVDELRNGLDPIAIIQAEKLLKIQQKKGATIIAATHDLWWAQRFSDEVVMLKAGKVMLHENTQHIVDEAGSLEDRFMELYAR